MESLSGSFLKELLKLCFFKRDVIEVCIEHMKYEYIPKNMGAYKQIFKHTTTYYTNNNHKLPTIGVISQMNSSNNEVQELLREINDTKLPDKEVLIKQLEEYIRRAKFQVLYDQVAEMYNKDQQSEAINFLAKESEKIASFSIYKGVIEYDNIFSGFNQRKKEREVDSLYTENKTVKIPFGIDEIDTICRGGAEKGETDLFIARSGTGKTKWLRYRGVNSARRGFRVLHFQAEGTKQECIMGYDATWSGQLKKDIKYAHLDPKIEEKLEKIIQDIINKQGEISVIAFEQFGQASTADIRNKIFEYKKINGVFPDHVIVDYLSKINPSDTRRYSASTEGEKMRKEAVADQFKNIAVECNLLLSTADQVNDISPNDWNRSEYVMTRHNLAGAKGLINPFSYCYTWNVTNDEYKNNTGRIYWDKAREFKTPTKPIYVASNFDRDRFYDRKRTIELFYEQD